MELWASGFNAWNQLQFNGELPSDPQDLNVFKCVLTDDKDIEVVRTSLSATLGKPWTFLYLVALSFPTEPILLLRTTSNEIDGPERKL
jgi:hypothetical protein